MIDSILALKSSCASFCLTANVERALEHGEGCQVGNLIAGGDSGVREKGLSWGIIKVELKGGRGLPRE
ncbi:hypothetical protein Tco_0572801 [Tanacetum coccineum]